jgi:hypothetical protein
MAKDKQKARSEQSALRMAKPPDLHDMLRESMSPAPTSELASSLQPKAGPSRASQVFFRPPTPAPDSGSDDDMDAANIEDSDPTINIPVAPTSTPPSPQPALRRWKGPTRMLSWRISKTQRPSMLLEPRTRS